MARSFSQILSSIWAAWGLTPSSSNFSTRKLVADGVARSMVTHEELFDELESEIENKIENTRFAYIPWLITAIKNFQFGYSLPENEVYYDNTGIAEELIEGSKVVKHCAIIELRRGLRIKVAGEDANGNLQPLTAEQETALVVYIKRIRPFCSFKLTNQPADKLHLNLEIYYDPLVLNSFGQRLDGTNDTPVTDASKKYLKNLEFNGRFVLVKLEDKLQAVDGIRIPHTLSAAGQYADTGLLPFDVFYLPDAGYLTFESLNITYIADE